MELAFILTSLLLISFALLGLYDGFFLHIFKYRLYEHAASKTEHLSHSIRALLFPGILYFLYFRQDNTSFFYIGINLVLADILCLGIDAYIEKDSRAFMGGLPRWEYILHLFVNGFHFAAIAVWLVIKIAFDKNTLYLRHDFAAVEAYHFFKSLVKNLLPGAVLMGVLHVFLIFPASRKHWNSFRSRLTCC